VKAYGDNIEKLFKISPGGSVEDIRVSFDGVEKLSVNVEGTLFLETDLGSVFMTNPEAFQIIDGVRKDIEASYVVDGTTYGFEVGQYDRRYLLVIDPLLASTFFGGTGDDVRPTIDIDSFGNIFVAGSTESSTDFPTTSSAFNQTFGGGTADLFVSKFNTDLTTLLASTLIGGSGEDVLPHISIDGSDNALVVASTTSSNFPTTTGAYDTSFNGVDDLVIFKLNNVLTLLVNSTYLGGTGSELGSFEPSIVIDSSDKIFVTTTTASTDFPVTNATFLSTFGSSGNGAGEFSGNQGVAVDTSSGNIVVVDSGNDRVQIFDSTGTFLSEFGSSGDGNGEFNFPIGAAINSLSRIIISDNGNDRIQIFKSSGTFLSKFGTSGSGNGQFSSMELLEVDSSDNIYVADTGNDRVQKFDSTGSFLLKFGSFGDGNGQFSTPHDVVINSLGNIIVADASNNRVQIFDSTGTFLSKFGSFCFRTK